MSNRLYIIFGRNVGNVLGQVRSFGEDGIKTNIIWYGEMPEPIKSSKYVACFDEVLSLEDGLKLLIEKYGSNPEKNILSTDNDGIVSLFDMHYNELAEKFIFFNAGKQGRLTELMTKMKQCELAVECGIRVPLSEVVTVNTPPQVVRYPIFTKSLDSFDYNWKSGVSICYTDEDLNNYYKKRNKGSKVLLQEYIKKENEYILQGISLDSGNILYMPIEGGYYRLPKDAYGSFLFFRNYKGGEQLKGKLQEMFRRIGYTGVFEVEFLRDFEGNLYFLEINFRHTLWNHTFTDMGINLCTIWANSVIEGKLAHNNACVKKEPHNLMREFQDFVRYKKEHKEDIFCIGWIKDLKNTDSFVIWDKRDKKPFFVYIISSISRVFKQILKRTF